MRRQDPSKIMAYLYYATMIILLPMLYTYGVAKTMALWPEITEEHRILLCMFLAVLTMAEILLFLLRPAWPKRSM
jgi:hypothetical protein